MTAKELKASILQLAVTGKLVPQDPNDEPASVLLERIKAEKAKLVKAGKIKKDKNPSEIVTGSDGAVYEKFGAGCSLAAKNTKDAKTGRAACPHAAESGKAALVADIDVPFEIPENWRWVRLGDICAKIGAGSTPLGGRKVYVPIGVKFIREQNVHNDGIHYDGMAFIDEATNRQMSSTVVKPSDLLMNITGASIGRVALVPDDFDMANVNQHVLIVRLLDASIRHYVHCCLCSPIMVREMWAKQKGDKPGLSAEKVKDFVFPLPPLAEQKRIVAKVEKLIPLVEEYGRMEETRLQLDADLPAMLEKSILQEAIQGKLVPQDPNDESASELLKRIAAERKALVKAGKLKRDKGESVIFRGSDRLAYETRNGETVCIQDEIPFDIPDSWEWVRLGSVSTIVRGSGIKRSETTGSGFPCIRYGEIYTTYGYSFLKAKSCTSEGVAAKCNKAHCGDVLCTLTGECKEEIAKATAYLGEEPIAIGGDLARISNHPYDPMLLVYFMFSPFLLSQKSDKSNGDIIVHIGKEAIENLLIPLPPAAEQKRIAAKVTNLLTEIKFFTK